MEKFPTLTATRLHGMVKERGYVGSVDHFRHFIALHRPKPKRDAYLRLRTLPGEQSQVDWGHFGTLEIGRAHRALMGFVRVLSWSRMIYVHFFLGAHMENFLRGHVGAFIAWGGLTRVVLYDNLKSAVLERQGQAGSSAACPGNAYQPAGTSCRPATGACDIEENCTGNSSSCPADALRSSGTVCRPSADACDIAETCTGSTAACPADVLQTLGTVCRAAAGQCDVAENCTGISASCPPDAYQPAGTACGDPADTACTDPDTCGGSGTCLDNHTPAGVPCNDGLFCTALDQCLNGQCAGSGSPCIPTEVCEEVSNQCLAIVSNDWWDSKWNYRKAITINASHT